MKKTFIIILFLFFVQIIFSQQVKVVKDFGFWGGVNIEKKITKKFTLNVEQQIRYFSNATKFDDYIIDFGGKYKINKNFKLGANARYIRDSKRWEDLENNYRYNFDLHYKGKISDKFNFFYRTRFQHKLVNLFSEPNITNIDHSTIRNKIKIQYRINKANRIYLSGEINRIIETFRQPYYNKLRFYAGDKIKSKIGIFDCAFGYEKEINTNYPLSFFFIKTTYTLRL